MNVKEVVTRHNIRKKITNHMKAKNWQLIGDGAYSVVFISPNNKKVLKVIAPSYEELPRIRNRNLPVEKDPDYSELKQEGETVQSQWLEFISKNKNNPHLPKFFKTKTETVKDGDSRIKLVVYEMEKLSPIPGDLEYLVTALRDAANPVEGAKPTEREKRLRRAWRGARKDIEYKPGYPKSEMEFIKKYTPFYNIMLEVFLFCYADEDNNVAPDTHLANFMMRGDTIVITDPWMGYNC